MEHGLKKRMLGERSVRKPFHSLREQIEALMDGKTIEIDVEEALDSSPDFDNRIYFAYTPLENGTFCLEGLYSICNERGEDIEKEMERILKLKRGIAYMELAPNAQMDAELAPSVEDGENYFLLTYQEILGQRFADVSECMERVNGVLNLYLLALGG